MEFINHISTSKSVDSIVSELSKDTDGVYDLGILFISEHNLKDIQELTKRLNQSIKIRNLLGCTCAGIISSHDEIERQTGTSLILARLPGVAVFPFVITQQQLEQYKANENWHEFFEVYPNENPVFLVLPDPYSLNMTKLIQNLNRAYPHCPVLGGLASASAQPYGNALIVNQEIRDEGLVGVVLTGNITINTVVSQGCRPIGETYIVTKAEENIIQELGGRPFWEVLKSVLDKIPARDKLLAQEAIFIGIAIDEYKHPFKRGDFLVRGVLGVDQTSGAGVIADFVSKGQTVQFHVRDAQSATEDLDELLRLHLTTTNNIKPKGALVFSCNGRGSYLFKQKNHDIDMIQKHLGPLPAAGFFCAGEIGPVGKANFLHGFTDSIALFYPKT